MPNMKLGMGMGVSTISRRLRGNKGLRVQETTDGGRRKDVITRSTTTVMEPDKAGTTIEVRETGPTMTAKLLTSSIGRQDSGRERGCVETPDEHATTL